MTDDQSSLDKADKWSIGALSVIAVCLIYLAVYTVINWEHELQPVRRLF